MLLGALVIGLNRVAEALQRLRDLLQVHVVEAALRFERLDAGLERVAAVAALASLGREDVVAEGHGGALARAAACHEEVVPAARGAWSAAAARRSLQRALADDASAAR